MSLPIAAPSSKRPAATNSCRVCAPLGAVLAFRGLRGCMPLIHGSQGCATYIRRYLISHYREPMDVASTSFDESATIFGGQSNLAAAIKNLVQQYRPEVIGVCTTCLAETIGEDTVGILRQITNEGPSLPPIIHVATPSFKGCQYRGFHDTVAAVLGAVARGGDPMSHLNLLPGPVSPADLRHLREIVEAFGLPLLMLPDYSETLDGPSLASYDPIPVGGVSLAEVAEAGRAIGTLQLGATLDPGPGEGLQREFGIPLVKANLPIGVRATDAVLESLAAFARQGAADSSDLVPVIPAWLTAERGRLVDAYVDGHKYVSGKRVAVVGDPDLAVAVAGFCAEVGLVPVLVASGALTHRMASALEALGLVPGSFEVMEDADYDSIQRRVVELKPDLVLGPSKAYPMTRALGIPLVRIGFPVHDRIGAGRILHLGYRGTQRLFDEVANALLADQQDSSEMGYAYQ
jgi:nitrogenase molybdenum-iron protein NifN